MRWRGYRGRSDNEEEPAGPMGREIYRLSGSWGDLVVEVANIAIATVFLYRRIRDLWHWRRCEGKVEVRREGDVTEVEQRR